MGGIQIRTDDWHKYSVRLNKLHQKYFAIRPYPDEKIPYPNSKLIDENGDYHNNYDKTLLLIFIFVMLILQ